MSNLTISNHRYTNIDGLVRVSALVDGDELFFEARNAPHPKPVSEPFIAIALLEAMRTGRTLSLEDGPPISARLFGRLAELQSVYACWNHVLHPIAIEASTSEEVSARAAVGSFFSGGLDSMHTLFQNQHSVTHLIVSRGFDHDDGDEGWARRRNKQAEFAQLVGKRLVEVNTNARDWLTSRRITWHYGHGLLLSSLGSFLGLKRAFISSSRTYAELQPWGSHPLIDPMWSTENCEVVHFGAGRTRSQKLADMLDSQEYLDNMTVCWTNTVKNCGQCSKCVRTIVAMELLQGRSSSLPAYSSATPIEKLKSLDDGLMTQLVDLINLAEAKNRWDIHRTLSRYARAYRVKKAMAGLDKTLLGGAFRKLKWKVAKPEWANWRVSLEDGADD